MVITNTIFYQSRCHWYTCRFYVFVVNVQELVWNENCFFNEHFWISVEFDETFTEKHWQKRQFFFCICHSKTTIVCISLWLAHLKLKIYNSTWRYKMCKEIRHIFCYKHDLAPFLVHMGLWIAMGASVLRPTEKGWCETAPGLCI